MTFLEYINTKNLNAIAAQKFFEGFNTKDMKKVTDLMVKLFNKKIEGVTLAWSNPVNVDIDGKKMLSYRFMNTKTTGGKINIHAIWTLNYLKSGESNEVYSIDFFNSEAATKLVWDGESKSTLTINTLGSSVAYFIPVICQIVDTGNFNISKDKVEKDAKSIFGKGVKESKMYMGSQMYTVYEGLSSSMVEDTFRLATGQVFESDEEDLKAARWQKKKERDEAWNNRKEDPETYKRVQAEYQEILDAIRGGKSIADLKFSIEKNVAVKEEVDAASRQVQKKVENKEAPEIAFRKMEIYLKSVITHKQPGAIVCGAPGVGKTYRVNRYLQAKGYKKYDDLVADLDEESEEIVIGAQDKVYMEIKGTCTVRQLYLALYRFRDANKVIIIDDADAVVGKNAPEVAINMLKAALDSTTSSKGRLVTYMVSGNLMDEYKNEIPKRMHFNGGVIVLTNQGVGMLNKAVKGRVFTQTLDFSVEQVLGLIEGLLENLGKEENLSMDSKQKALTYLRKLSGEGVTMDISIRSFISAARLYDLTNGEGLTEKQVEEMIEEQMRNQADSGSKSFN